MMKKAGILFLVLMYVVTSTGFALNLHYCGNHVADIKINAPAKSCVKPMAKSKMKCCKDTKLDVKVKDSHENQPNSFLPKKTPVDVPKSAFADFILPVHQLLLDVLFDRGPPDAPRQNVPQFIKNRTLKI
ncbi:hypothetical protein ACFQZI_17645 [Mucilaginibacter lutimaris]|uniref:Secreted protein n=1 Tax=Mucilaginibacter lutimaris TaxID=931629 RepID=A0ABW2ZKA1_9SPHI